MCTKKEEKGGRLLISCYVGPSSVARRGYTLSQFPFPPKIHTQISLFPGSHWRTEVFCTLESSCCARSPVSPSQSHPRSNDLTFTPVPIIYTVIIYCVNFPSKQPAPLIHNLTERVGTLLPLWVLLQYTSWKQIWKYSTQMLIGLQPDNTAILSWQPSDSFF